jgi:hypothetical protein
MKTIRKSFALDTQIFDRLYDYKEFRELFMKHHNCGEYSFTSSNIQIEEIQAMNQNPAKRSRLLGIAGQYAQVNPTYSRTSQLVTPLEKDFERGNSEDFWSVLHFFMMGRHNGENDCLIARAAAAAGSIVLTDDHKFADALPDFTFKFENFKIELAEHDRVCGK